MVHSRRLRHLLLFAAVIGFVLQVSQVVKQYFRFETRSQVSFVLDQRQQTIGASICIDAYSLINWKALGRQQELDVMSWLTTAGNLTLKRLFEATPTAEQVIKVIWYRDADGVMRISDGNEWQRVTNMTRFYSQGCMCYKIAWQFDNKYHPDDVRLASSFTFILYQITFTHQVKDARNVSIILAKDDVTPFTSRMYTSVNHPSRFINSYTAHQTRDTVYLLPKPYDTSCTQASGQEYFDCVRLCIVNGSMAKGMASDTLIHTRPLDLSLMPLLPDNQTMQWSHGLRRSCHRRCYRKPCAFFHSVTHTSLVAHTTDSLQVSVRTSQMPSKETTHVAVMTFIEFFSFLCTSIGAWFGVSFLSFMTASQWLMRRQQDHSNRVTVLSNS